MDEQDFADRISEMTVNMVELKARSLPLFDKPIVYMATGEGVVLYVGMSRKGLCRVFGRGHHVLSKIYDLIENIQVYETKTVIDAEKLESLLIREFRPKFNGRGMVHKALYSKQGHCHVSEMIDAYSL